MAISLYDLTIPAFTQTMGAVSQILKIGAAHLDAAGIDRTVVEQTRLRDNMLPFQFQVWSVCHLPVDAVAGLKAGIFDPLLDWQGGALDYASLQQNLSDARKSLESVTPEEINACEGKTISFTFEGREMTFVAENFIHSFLLPNLYFHATTTYSILRMAGAPLDKPHYLGRVRMSG